MVSEYKGVMLTYDDLISADEAEQYAERQLEKWKERNISSINVAIDAVDNEYVIVQPREYNPFSRIRRVTGYLVGTLDRWNNAKRAEERDRVKHSV
jgi:hypothetical protein